MEALITKVNAFLTKLYPSCLYGLVPVDKFMHILGGFVIGAVLTPFMEWHAVVFVALVAMLKEIYDYIHRNIHTPDLWDWVATVLGGLVGFVVVVNLI